MKLGPIRTEIKLSFMLQKLLEQMIISIYYFLQILNLKMGILIQAYPHPV